MMTQAYRQSQTDNDHGYDDADQDDMHNFLQSPLVP